MRLSKSLPLFVALIVGITCAMTAVLSRTEASFSGTSSNDGNSWTVGSVSLTNDRSGTALFTIGPLKPNVVVARCITVTYNGSVPAAVRISATTTGTLGHGLATKIYRGTGGAVNCTGFTADPLPYLGPGNPSGLIYDDVLDAMPRTWATALADPQPNNPSTWSPGDAHTYRIETILVNDDSQQGMTGGATFTWEAHSASDDLTRATDPLNRSFADTMTSGLTLTGDARLTAVAGTDTAGAGWLQLTSATANRAGDAFLATGLPSAQGIVADFDFAVGGTADAFGFGLRDASATGTSPGAVGQDFGYTGISGVYMGVGFNEYGRHLDLRRSSTAQWMLTRQANLTTSIRNVSRSNPGHAWIIVTSSGRLTARIRYPGALTPTLLFDDVQLVDTVPASWKILLSAGTGGASAAHEIRNLHVRTID